MAVWRRDDRLGFSCHAHVRTGEFVHRHAARRRRRRRNELRHAGHRRRFVVDPGDGNVRQHGASGSASSDRRRHRTAGPGDRAAEREAAGWSTFRPISAGPSSSSSGSAPARAAALRHRGSRSTGADTRTRGSSSCSSSSTARCPRPSPTLSSTVSTTSSWRGRVTHRSPRWLAYGVSVTPTAFLVDRTGVIRYTGHPSGLSEEFLTRWL